MKLSKVPDVQPIVIGCYTLTAVGLDVTGRPSFSEHEGVGEFIARAHKASGFWWADHMRYGESRKDWKARLDQAEGATGLSRKRLANIRAAGAIDKSRRRENVDLELHIAVAGMPAEEQDHWLGEADREQWTLRELRQHLDKAARTTVLDGKADSVYTVDVTVQISIVAQSPHKAQTMAWDTIKQALADEAIKAKVIAAHAR